MICPACGAHLDDDSKFCDVCGSRVAASGLPETEAAGTGTVNAVTGSLPAMPAGPETGMPAEPGAGTSAEPGAGVSAAGKAASTLEKGAAGTAASAADDSSKRGAEDKLKLPLKVIGLIVGTIFIVIGFMRIASAGTSISSTSFGADFYTYTYQGIVAVADILASIELTLGWILAAIGAAIDIMSLRS